MIPTSTYRLQLHSGFTLKDAADIADYLSMLGVSHTYASPYLQAAEGSMHGYDVVDHHKVSDELGGEEAYRQFCKRLGECGLGQILDIVPNHMSLAHNNRYWWDVLENGASSPYAEYFDINWEPAEVRLSNKVLLPVLGDQYGVILANQEIQIVSSGVRFEVHYADHRMPISPNSIPAFLCRAASASCSDTLEFLADAFGHLPQPDYSDRRTILKRHRDKKVLYDLLARTCSESSSAMQSIENAIAELNKDCDALDAFLQQQNYRLAYWRVSDQDLGYRRFFDVNSLIGVRVEREQVFLETHERILGWLRDGVIDGVRVDHADGLRDPQQYFERLRQAAPNAWVVTEKILQPTERLRENWPVHGTTGYEFLNQINSLLISREGLKAIDAIYEEFTGERNDYGAMCHEKKLAVTQEGLGSDVNRLTSQFIEICENNRAHRDTTRADVRRALRELAACFPVYRAYVSPRRSEISDAGVEAIEYAMKAAVQYRPDIDSRLFDFIGDVLMMRDRGAKESEFLQRFQQFTGPVMAKGVEDTAMYCYNRLVSLNEVGGDPARDPITIEEFHQLNSEAQRLHPYRMVTLTTHDTKRSEDVRARLAVLTESPECFRSAIQRWRLMNDGLRVNGMPDANTEYLYYQTLIGAWPLSEERAQQYMLKAVREAKLHTSWTHNNSEFEDALRGFIKSTLESKEFIAEVERLVAHIQTAGRINSLAQTLVKNTAPGVPDLYQGSELWDYRLVDPDNRTPVDYAARRQMMEELKTMNIRQIKEKMAEGAPKLWTIQQALKVRAEYPACFDEKGAYRPIFAIGARSEHVIAFRRGEEVVSVVPRLTRGLADGWADTTIELSDGRWRNQLTSKSIKGGTVPVSNLFSEFPVALLTRE